MSRPRSRRKGFTLLELIVVVVVLGILAALAIPSFSTVKQSAADKVAIQSAESVVRNAEALAAFEGASLNDGYVDAAGAEVTGYNSSLNTVTITSGGKTAVATIDAVTGAVSISTSNGGGGSTLTPNSVIGSRTFGEIDGDSSSATLTSYHTSLFTWSAGGVEYFAYGPENKSWWVDVLTSAPTVNANGSKTWTILEPNPWDPARSAFTQYKLSADGSTIEAF